MAFEWTDKARGAIECHACNGSAHINAFQCAPPQQPKCVLCGKYKPVGKYRICAKCALDDRFAYLDGMDKNEAKKVVGEFWG